MRGIIYASTLLAITTCLAVATHASTEDCQVRTNPGVLLEQDGTQGQAVAVTLEVVSSKNCYWCKKLKKETIPTLVSMGYNVVLANRINDKRGTTRFPTLYYLDAKGNVVLKQIGFQTAAEVIKHLKKP